MYGYSLPPKQPDRATWQQYCRSSGLQVCSSLKSSLNKSSKARWVGRGCYREVYLVNGIDVVKLGIKERGWKHCSQEINNYSLHYHPAIMAHILVCDYSWLVQEALRPVVEPLFGRDRVWESFYQKIEEEFAEAYYCADYSPFKDCGPKNMGRDASGKLKVFDYAWMSMNQGY